VIYTYPSPPPGTGCHPLRLPTSLRKPPPNLNLLLLGWGSWNLAQHRGIHVLVVVARNVSCLLCVVIDHVLILVVNERDDVQQNDTWNTTIMQEYQKQDTKTLNKSTDYPRRLCKYFATISKQISYPPGDWVRGTCSRTRHAYRSICM
jgi:hypothetical protein